MTKAERACQIWGILAWVAKNRQSLTYSHLSKLIGVPTAGLGQLLEPIQSFCIRENLPPLCILVVQQESGLPGSGFIGAKESDFPKAQIQVFNFDWLEYGNPQPEGFEKKEPILWDQKIPTNGIVPPACNVYKAFEDFTNAMSLDKLPQYKKQNLRDLQFHKLSNISPNLTNLPDAKAAKELLTHYKDTMDGKSDLTKLPRPIKDVFLVGWARICGKNSTSQIAKHLYDSGFGGTLNASTAIVTVGKSTGRLFGLLDNSDIPTILFYDYFEIDLIQKP